jgi:hypothetical protein
MTIIYLCYPANGPISMRWHQPCDFVSEASCPRLGKERKQCYSCGSSHCSYKENSMISKRGRLFVYVVLLAVVAFGSPSKGTAQSQSAESCPANCIVTLYPASSSCTKNNVTRTFSLDCGWGGPGTCCNPTIKRSTTQGIGTETSCGTQGAAPCIINRTTNYVTYTCCCNPIETDGYCETILSKDICQTTVKIG